MRGGRGSPRGAASPRGGGLSPRGRGYIPPVGYIAPPPGGSPSRYAPPLPHRGGRNFEPGVPSRGRGEYRSWREGRVPPSGPALVEGEGRTYSSGSQSQEEDKSRSSGRVSPMGSSPDSRGPFSHSVSRESRSPSPQAKARSLRSRKSRKSRSLSPGERSDTDSDEQREPQGMSPGAPRRGRSPPPGSPSVGRRGRHGWSPPPHPSRETRGLGPTPHHRSGQPHLPSTSSTVPSAPSGLPMTTHMRDTRRAPPPFRAEPVPGAPPVGPGLGLEGGGESPMMTRAGRRKSEQDNAPIAKRLRR